MVIMGRRGGATLGDHKLRLVHSGLLLRMARTKSTCSSVHFLYFELALLSTVYVPPALPLTLKRSGVSRR